MAMTARAERAERATMVRSRVHAAGPGGARVMVKSTAEVAHVVARPQLTLLPARRRAARLVAAGCFVVFALMIGAAAFQTQLARRQLTLDALDRQIRLGHEQYDVLRRERAELRSPGRLWREAGNLGMVPATQTEFVALDPSVVAEVQRSGGGGAPAAATTLSEVLTQYTTVKAQAGGAP